MGVSWAGWQGAIRRREDVELKIQVGRDQATHVQMLSASQFINLSFDVSLPSSAACDTPRLVLQGDDSRHLDLA